MEKGFSRVAVTCALASTLTLTASPSYASRFQAFSGLSYANPAAMLLTVPGTQIIVGDDLVGPKASFNGTVTVPPPVIGLKAVTTSGHSANRGTFDMPYGRVAQRLSDHCVIGVDFTEPYTVNISYPPTSAVRYAGTAFIIGSQDIAPNIAYQFSGFLKDLAVGAGLDAFALNATLNQMVPSLPPGGFGTKADTAFDNSISGRAYGWHVGALYHLLTPTYVGVGFFSEIKLRLNGTSYYIPNYGQKAVSTTLTGPTVLPPTFTFNLDQLFSDRWRADLGFYYTRWSRVPNIQFVNTAGPRTSATTVFNYPNTWRLSIKNYEILTPKWDVTELVAYDYAPTNAQERTPLTPTTNTYTLGVAAEYHVTKILSVAADYSHVFFKANAAVNRTSPTGIVTIGETNVGANVIGLKFTVNT